MEFETFIKAMEIMNFFCFVGEDGFRTIKIACFHNLFGRNLAWRKKKIAATYIPRTQNTRTDNFARDARKRQSYFVYIDTDSLVWLPESYRVCLCGWHKKTNHHKKRKISKQQSSLSLGFNDALLVKQVWHVFFF